jgi:hypothetical protein
MKNKFSRAVFLFTFISGTAENVSESVKHEKRPDDFDTVENKTRRTQYRRKWIRERKIWNRVPTPSVSREMTPGAQNMKSGANALVTAENESGSATHENGTRRPRYRRKRVLKRKTWKREPTPSAPPKMSPDAQNIKMGPDALGKISYLNDFGLDFISSLSNLFEIKDFVVVVVVVDFDPFYLLLYS